jgi:hypothetical protein
MKKHVYLITTAAAALLAGTVFAAAQGMQKQAPGGAAEQSPPSQGQGQEQKKEQTQPGQKQGQSQKEGQKQDQGQKQAQPQTQGQGQKQDQKQAQPKTDGQGQKQDAQQKSGGSVTFTTEQRTRVRTTVLQDSNAPRATSVNFSINVGTAVPTSVRVVTVPQLILDVQPEWRGHMYFIVGDQIIIVDRNHRIVAVIDV